MLEILNVSKSFLGKDVLRDFSLQLPQRGTVAILGPSGCGKTTLLRLIAGLEKPDRGQILLPEHAKVSVVFQEDRLMPALDALGNVLAVLDGGPESRRFAEECLSRCGLNGAMDEYPAALSGGMQRRVAIARAIAFQGDILLLDEPFKGLDDETKRQVCDFVFEKACERLTLFITHDREEAEAFSDSVLQFEGTPLRVVGRQKLRDAGM